LINLQKKVFKELQEIFGDDLERPVTEKELGKMRYLECCLKEALRLMPPVSFITRRVGCEVQLGKIIIIILCNYYNN
jgi:cytochrome P450